MGILEEKKDQNKYKEPEVETNAEARTGAWVKRSIEQGQGHGQGQEHDLKQM